MNTKNKIKCLDCIQAGNTCCEGNCSRFVTLHDLLRLQKLGCNVDEISSFEKMADWEIEHQQDDIHCDYYDLAIDQKLLMLKKGEDKCIFLDDKNLCQIHKVGILFCKFFPFWFVETNGATKIVFDPCACDCPIAGKNMEELNDKILAGKLTLDDSYFEQIGETAKSLLDKYEQFKVEMAEYKKYSKDLASGAKPSEVIKKYKLE